MDGYFFNVDKYLTRKRKEACKDLCNFVWMDSTFSLDGHCRDEIMSNEIETAFNSAHEKVKLQFQEECEFLRNNSVSCVPSGNFNSANHLRNKYEFRDSVIDGIKPRQLKKIEDFKNYKLSVVRGHCKSKGDNDQSICKYDLEKLLSKNNAILD